MSKLLILVALVAAAAFVSASSPSVSVLFTRNAVPDNWSKGALASPDARVDFTIALTQRNLDVLDQWFNEASDPTHVNYQNYKTIDEISQLVAPAAADSTRVLNWLHAAGVAYRNIASFGDALDVTTTVRVASTLFSTQFFVFQHVETGAKIIRQYGSYSVPADLADMIEIVTGLSTFPIPHLDVQRPVSNDYGVVPQTVEALYSVTAPDFRRRISEVVSAPLTVSTAVIEFQGQNYAPSDLAGFAQGIDVNIPALPADHIIGPNDPTQPQTEATLDIQMTAGIFPEAQNWFWLEQGNGWLYQFATHFFGTEDVPQVNSISYGWWEGDQCTIDGDECQALGVDSAGYVKRVNTEFQKIGLRGISLIAASGDSGANGRTDPSCSDPHLRPSFPGTSPFITAVGATELVDVEDLNNPPPICAAAGLDCAGTGTEQAVSYAISSFASGGGFSDISAQPQWQQDAVTKYLNSGVKLPGPGYFNKTGRGMPDVAAVGHNVIINDGGAPQPVGGTSCASPIFAAIVSMLNVEQIKLTGKPLGFLNPWLYTMWAADPSTFQDITVGDNKCTENGCTSTCEGYECAPGWDPVTGLGTPNYERMLAYLQKSAAQRKIAKQ